MPPEKATVQERPLWGPTCSDQKPPRTQILNLIQIYSTGPKTLTTSLHVTKLFSRSENFLPMGRLTLGTSVLGSFYRSTTVRGVMSATPGQHCAIEHKLSKNSHHIGLFPHKSG